MDFKTRRLNLDFAPTKDAMVEIEADLPADEAADARKNDRALSSTTARELRGKARKIGRGKLRGTKSKFKRAFSSAALVLAAFAGGAVTTQLASASTGQESPYEILNQLARVLVLVENEYVDPVDRERLLEGSIKGMVSELDPHSSYLTKEDFAIFRGDTEGRFGGVGVEVDFSGDDVVVIAPIENSPAARSGIRSGDRIVAIDGQSVRGRSPEQLVRDMRGKPGTEVMVTVRRAGEDRLLQFKLKREIIAVASISAKLLDAGIGYIRIKSFQAGTHSELLEKLAQLRSESKSPLAGLILDMRNNPGGLVNEASAVADEFLTGGVIYTTRHRGKVLREARARKAGALRRGPLVVLVNEYSASAAELVTGALKDNHRAIVVGAPTFGKGSVQSIVDLPNGAGLKLTTARYYTPSGRAIQAQGVTPDVRVEAGYVSDDGVEPLRERDLENYLPPEASIPSDMQEPAHSKAPAEGGDQPTHLGVSQEVPDNPTGGSDVALSIGYQIVTGVLTQRPARAR